MKGVGGGNYRREGGRGGEGGVGEGGGIEKGENGGGSGRKEWGI